MTFMNATTTREIFGVKLDIVELEEKWKVNTPQFKKWFRDTFKGEFCGFVWIDLSKKSQSAIKKAVQIAHQFKSHITILNVREEFMSDKEMKMARVSITGLKEKFRQIALDAKSEIKNIIERG